MCFKSKKNYCYKNNDLKNIFDFFFMASVQKGIMFLLYLFRCYVLYLFRYTLEFTVIYSNIYIYIYIISLQFSSGENFYIVTSKIRSVVIQQRDEYISSRKASNRCSAIAGSFHIFENHFLHFKIFPDKLNISMIWVYLVFTFYQKYPLYFNSNFCVCELSFA